MLSRQLELLSRLFDDLLDSSAITKEILSLHKEKIEVETLIDRAVETSMASISAGNHSIEVLPTDNMIYVEADIHRMVQVISSLLMIASKHSPSAGQITISILLKVDTVQIKIKFEEEAIQESGLDSANEVELSKSQSQVELEAGLTFANNLVELHSGSIEVKFGDRGQESEFIINLPVLQQIAKSAIDFQPLDFLPNGFNRSILVVDDNYEAAKLLSSQLEKFGNRVYTVQKGENALDVARRFKPEIAFLDIGRPQSNGYSLAEQIRRDRSISHAVLVAQTDSNQSTNVDVFSKAGFDLHLVKPLNAEAVKTILLDTVFVGEASSLLN